MQSNANTKWWNAYENKLDNTKAFICPYSDESVEEMKRDLEAIIVLVLK